MNVLDLFSGVGGFSLGLERAGMHTVAFCEIDKYCHKVLKKHWPHVPIYQDIRTLTAKRLCKKGITIDLICGGFPCQDISVAGKGAGIKGERSGLWSEYARVISEVRPRYVIVENVSALLTRGLDRVLGDLATLGYDAEWHCIPASVVGAPHRRDRVWIMAYARREQRIKIECECECETKSRTSTRFRNSDSPLADSNHTRSKNVANATSKSTNGHARRKEKTYTLSGNGGETGADSDSQPTQRFAITWSQCDQWLVEPNVGRVVDGISSRVDRLRCLGNAVVPQVVEMIGRSILLDAQS